MADCSHNYCLFCCCCPCPRYYGISTFVRCKNWCTLISRSYHTTAHLITHHTTSCPALAHSCFVSVPPSDSGPRQCARRCPSSQAAPAPGTGSQRASGWHKIPIESTLLPHELPHLQPVAVVKVNRRPVLPLLRQLVHRARAPPREAADHEDELQTLECLSGRPAKWPPPAGATEGRRRTSIRLPTTRASPSALQPTATFQPVPPNSCLTSSTSQESGGGVGRMRPHRTDRRGAGSAEDPAAFGLVCPPA